MSARAGVAPSAKRETCSLLSVVNLLIRDSSMHAHHKDCVFRPEPACLYIDSITHVCGVCVCL
jgi:hypothetical protein